MEKIMAVLVKINRMSLKANPLFSLKNVSCSFIILLLIPEF